MELKEAIQRLKDKINEDKKYLGRCPFSDIMETILDDNKAINTVLQALEKTENHKSKIRELECKIIDYKERIHSMRRKRTKRKYDDNNNN